MSHRRRMIVAAATLLAVATPAFGQASQSLDKCQKEASGQLGKYMAAKEKTLGACLGKIAKEVIKSGDPVADAAKACGSQLRKFVNTASPNKTLLAKTKDKIRKRCDPAFTSLAHTSAQVLELVPPVVSEGVEAKNLNDWCTYFDFDDTNNPGFADGSLDSVEEWIDCTLAVTDCGATQAIVTRYPRALEWLAELETALIALGPKYADAVTAVQELQDSIDVFGNGNPTINCGPGVDSCGDGVANGTDQCDAADLGGATCASLGFKGGNLACDGGCYYDFTGCVAGAFPATGQTTSYIANDDGALENGAAFSLVYNNVNGTVFDANSGLMWEVKDNAGGLHDRDNQYTWPNAFDVFLATMNNTCDGNELTPCTQNSDCTGIGNQLCGHAGYRDWRMPNRTELQTILNMGAGTPAVPAAFDNACAGSCSVTACSCTRATAVAKYWSSSTYAGTSTFAWYVDFGGGNVNYDGTVTTQFVRAVRGGGL